MSHLPSGRCLVVGYDRSASSQIAAEWAARWLAPDGRLVIVHACRPLLTPPSAMSTPSERTAFGHALIDDLMMSSGETLLQLDVDTEVLDEDPVTALLDAAKRHEAQAIVIGSEHRSKLRAVVGTVTTELLRATPVPLIAVPRSVGEPSPQLALSRGRSQPRR